MSPQEEVLKATVRKEIDELKSLTKSNISVKSLDAIWVLSGPGTYADSLKKSEPSWEKWMDHDRLRFGVELCKEVKDTFNKTPILIYNGIPEENRVLRLAIDEGKVDIPKDNILIIDSVTDNKEASRPIAHTLDQVKSFPVEIFEKVESLGIVSHVYHLPRILRYLSKYETIPWDVKIHVYPLEASAEAQEIYEDEEVEKIWKYFNNNDLSWDPLLIEN